MLHKSTVALGFPIMLMGISPPSPNKANESQKQQDLNRTTRHWHSPHHNPPALRAAPFMKGGGLYPPLSKGGEGGFITLSHGVYESHAV